MAHAVDNFMLINANCNVLYDIDQLPDPQIAVVAYIVNDAPEVKLIDAGASALIEFPDTIYIPFVPSVYDVVKV